MRREKFLFIAKSFPQVWQVIVIGAAVVRNRSRSRSRRVDIPEPADLAIKGLQKIFNAEPCACASMSRNRTRVISRAPSAAMCGVIT